MITGFYIRDKNSDNLFWEEIENLEKYKWLYTVGRGCSVTFTYTSR